MLGRMMARPSASIGTQFWPKQQRSLSNGLHVAAFDVGKTAFVGVGSFCMLGVTAFSQESDSSSMSSAIPDCAQTVTVGNKSLQQPLVYSDTKAGSAMRVCEVQRNTSIWRRVDDAEMEMKASQIPHALSVSQAVEMVDFHRSLMCVETNSSQHPGKASIWRRMDDAEMEILPCPVPCKASSWRRMDDASMESDLGQVPRLTSTSIWRRMDDAEMEIPSCPLPCKASIWRRMDDAEAHLFLS